MRNFFSENAASAFLEVYSVHTKLNGLAPPPPPSPSPPAHDTALPAAVARADTTTLGPRVACSKVSSSYYH